MGKNGVMFERDTSVLTFLNQCALLVKIFEIL